MESYFHAAIQQLRERARLLMIKIPRDLPREFHLLIQTCGQRIDDIVSRLDYISEDSNMLMEESQSVRLRHLRRIVMDLDTLETIAIVALNRVDPEEDIWLNQLVERITREINYPLLPPVVTSLSSEYFHVYPGLGLLRIPLVEGHFLLHLPDLYHELAHLLLAEQNDPRVKPFQDALMHALDSVVAHFTLAMQKEQRRSGPVRLQFYMEGWLRSWGHYWLVEFMCDAFATCVLGPAFAWAHLHLVAKRGSNTYGVPRGAMSRHPADGARMQVQLHGLRLLGFSSEVGEIERRWDELGAISNAQPDPDYRQCYPDDILKAVAEAALEGVRLIGCRVASAEAASYIGSVMNEAWGVFWRDPIGYSGWEKETVRRLRTEPR